MKIVIVGCGRVGSHLAAALDAEEHEVAIMDKDPYSFRRLPKSFRGVALVGDGTNEESLKRAKIEEADILVAVTQGDNRNILAAQIAKHVFKVPRVLCRIYDPLRQELYETLELETISPTITFSQLLKERILG